MLHQFSRFTSPMVVGLSILALSCGSAQAETLSPTDCNLIADYNLAHEDGFLQHFVDYVHQDELCFDNGLQEGCRGDLKRRVGRAFVGDIERKAISGTAFEASFDTALEATLRKVSDATGIEMYFDASNRKSGEGIISFTYVDKIQMAMIGKEYYRNIIK